MTQELTHIHNLQRIEQQSNNEPPFEENSPAEKEPPLAWKSIWEGFAPQPIKGSASKEK